MEGSLRVFLKERRVTTHFDKNHKHIFLEDRNAGDLPIGKKFGGYRILHGIWKYENIFVPGSKMRIQKIFQKVIF